MTKEQRKRIETEFYRYEQNRNEAANFISDRALAGMGVDYSKERVKASHGNSVEESVVKTVDDYMRMYKWCLVYEKTYDHFKWTHHENLMEMKYIDKNHKECICDVLHIAPRTHDYWVVEILERALLWAEEYKLL